MSDMCTWKDIVCPHVGDMRTCSSCSKGNVRNPVWEDRTFKGWVDNQKTILKYKKLKYPWKQ